MAEHEGPRAIVNVKVHPRSTRNKLDYFDEVLHVWITAPPVQGAANEAVIALLAQSLSVPPRNICLVRGSTARHKCFLIQGITLSELREKITKLYSNDKTR
jgi:uncharacterized protein